MQRLIELQQQMRAYMLGQRDLATPWVASQDAKLRLNVYADGYYLRLVEILAKDYPQLQKWLGDECFGKLAYAYVDAYPSSYYSVDFFGQDMAQFLSKQDLPAYYAEMAQFEWALSQATILQDAPIITQQALLSVNPLQWPEICFTFHPSLQVLELHSNIPAIWQEINTSRPIPAILTHETATTWLVWRKSDFIAYFCPLTPVEATVFQAVLAKKPFWQVCEDLLALLPEAEIADFVVNLLLRWLNEQLLSEIGFS
jgi:hypothetical protein